MWTAMQEALKVDGSLRDIYIHGTTLEDWQRFLDLARTYETQFLVDQEPAALPERIEEIMAKQASCGTCLVVALAPGLDAHCHFFMTFDDLDPLELDVDPKQLQTTASHEALRQFMGALARALGKTCGLDRREYALIRSRAVSTHRPQVRSGGSTLVSSPRKLEEWAP